MIKLGFVLSSRFVAAFTYYGIVLMATTLINQDGTCVAGRRENWLREKKERKIFIIYICI